jgi:biopolymer transport protein ExbB/TolQ
MKVLAITAAVLIAAIMGFLLFAYLVYRARKYAAQQTKVRDEIAELIYQQNIGVIPTDENTPQHKAEENKDWFED